MIDILTRLGGYNPPDRTIEIQRQMAVDIQDAKAEIERLQKVVRRLQGERRVLRNPFRAADDQDWKYIVSLIPDGGRGRFWKSVLAEMRAALATNSEPAA